MPEFSVTIKGESLTELIQNTRNALAVLEAQTGNATPKLTREQIQEAINRQYRNRIFFAKEEGK